MRRSECPSRMLSRICPGSVPDKKGLPPALSRITRMAARACVTCARAHIHVMRARFTNSFDLCQGQTSIDRGIMINYRFTAWLALLLTILVVLAVVFGGYEASP